MGAFFYNLIVYPIEMIVEALFVFFFKAFDNLGLAIAAISILVSLLSLPLYHIAEKLQEKERTQRLRMQPGIRRIKETFKGDEQYMMLSTYYRQQHYHPAYALRSSVSLMIQVPFFIAAYHFLSHLPQLQGESFLFIKDLGTSDALFHIGSVSINLLPILMTCINVIAGTIYSKGFPLRDKLQLYGMAGLFLVLLYQSPAGLVYYWTLNNIFSLIKNIFYKLKRPLPILYLLGCISILTLSIALLIKEPDLDLLFKAVLFLGCLLMFSIPLLLKTSSSLFTRYLSGFAEEKGTVRTLFILSSLLIWVLCGIYVPVSVIKSSPIEFSFLGDVSNPLGFVFNTATILFGLFSLWPMLLYGMGSKQMKAVFAFGFSLVACTALFNIFVFDGDYGTISKLFMFDNAKLLHADGFLAVGPILISILLTIVLAKFLQRMKWSWMTKLVAIILIAASVYSVYSMVQVQSQFSKHARNIKHTGTSSSNEGDIEPVFSLSKEGSNVVILFLDRAISSFFPVILEQFPQLKDTYSGFTFYPNTVSFGAYTLTGAPPVMGGYEYTPDEINKRDAEKLVDKHNEAMLVIPRLFSEAGYNVSVFDPPYSNYQWANDFAPFKKYPEMTVQALRGKFSTRYKLDHVEGDAWGPNYESRLIKRRLPLYSLVKMVFPVLRELMYLKGSYFLMDENPNLTNYFIDSYSTLHYLPKLTEFDQKGNNYVFIANDATHDPAFLQAPEYVPVSAVTNKYTPLDDSYEEDSQLHYHANAAVILKIGEWLEFLKQNDVYDNTRIIIVSDHGRGFSTPVFKEFGEGSEVFSFYNPLLLAKDFYTNGPVTEDESFMTNADVPLKAIAGLPVSSDNPFTGKDLYEAIKKSSVNSYYSGSSPDKHTQNLFVFDMTKSFSVHDSIFDKLNWTKLQSEYREL